MKEWTAFWNILLKDIKTYYLKPPNISWGIIFPFAWTLMFYLRSSSAVEIKNILPGVVAMSILFGTTSMLSVTITFERRSKSFDRLLLSPLSLSGLMLAKTAGAVLFGVFNAFVPIVFASVFMRVSGIHWWQAVSAIILISATSTFLGLFIAVSVSEVFEAQTFSNFFRFPMVFLCGLFFPLERLPFLLRPLSFALPLTYGADLLKSSILHIRYFSIVADVLALGAFALVLFFLSLRNVQRKWIL
jgi:ABC-2 type transport system permease protein